jgi:serine protease
MALEEGRRTLTLPLLAKEAGTHSARAVAEGEGLRREVPFRLVVAEPRAERAALEGTVYVGVPEGLSPQAWGGRWYRAPGGGLFPDRPLRAQGQGEPLFPRQWGLALAGFPEAWARGRGEGVVVAVPDTGVLKDHPDLRGALLPGLDLVDGDADPEATSSWP